MVTFKFFVQKFFVDLAKKSKVADDKAAVKNSSKSADDLLKLADIFAKMAAVQIFQN